LRRQRRLAITRLEVIIALVLCSFAAGLGIVRLARFREDAQQVQCRNNLRAIGKAFHAYHDASSANERLRYLPPARIADGYATWAVLLAPHLVQEHPLHQWDKQQSYFAQKDEVRESRVIVFFCPARSRTGTLSLAGDLDKANKLFPGGLGDYACVAGDGSADHEWTGSKANGALVVAEVIVRKDSRILDWLSRTSLNSFTRGTAYTMLVGEKHVLAAHQGEAELGDGSVYNGQHPASFARIAGPGYPLADAVDAPFNNNFGSYHKGVCQFLMADGSFRALSTNTSELVLGRMARRGD
jgi:type II secretory pathway pseudopilin PulG